MKSKQFEHKIVELGSVLPYPGNFVPKIATDKLDHEGQESWELVSVIAIGPHATHAMAFFKREVKTE